MNTSFFIFTPSNLHQAAWLALLENQPGITISGTFGDLKEISPLSLKQSTAILVDILAIQVDFVSQLNAALPDHGLLILVDHYELDKIVSFLRAGATGLLSRDTAVSDLARAIIAIPLAMGILAPFGFIMPPAIGALLMSLSTVIVAINAQTLRRLSLNEGSPSAAVSS